MRRGFSLLLLVSALGWSLPSRAEEPHHVATDSPATAAHGEGAEHGEHVPSVDQINWYYGMLGEREGVEPNVLFRPKGMQAPLGALLLNSALLYFILYRTLRKPISEGLKRRKQTLLAGMEDAARMRREAEKQLAEYEGRLSQLDQEMARLQRETRASAEAERVRILQEARDRRERMEREAALLIAQELSGAREELMAELAASAIRSARETLRSKVTEADQLRFADEFLRDVRKAAPALRGRL